MYVHLVVHTEGTAHPLVWLTLRASLAVAGDVEGSQQLWQSQGIQLNQRKTDQDMSWCVHDSVVSVLSVTK